MFDHGRVIARDTPDGLKRIVGGQTLAVRPADPARLAEVAALLGDVAGVRPGPAVQGSLSAPVRDDTALTALVARLAERDIAVTELSLKLPSLDEVFFTLTGRNTELEVAA